MANTLQTWQPHITSQALYFLLWVLSRQGSQWWPSRHVLERTGRNVSLTGIDDHELPGLDIVTCVALIQINHGKVNMLMHEHAYYGRGNTIHSPCQIEWFYKTCEAKSHHVGGKQVIKFVDGYTAPLECRSGLMYMSTIGKPTDQDLDQYPHVLLTSPHEWDPSVLDYSHPNTHGYPPWAPDPRMDRALGVFQTKQRRSFLCILYNDR